MAARILTASKATSKLADLEPGVFYSAGGKVYVKKRRGMDSGPKHVGGGEFRIVVFCLSDWSDEEMDAGLQVQPHHDATIDLEPRGTV